MRDRGADFDDFVVGAAPALMRVAVALTADRGAAEDLLQDVLERLYVAWPRVDDPLAYARRALTNASANRWRLRSRRPEGPLLNTTEPLVSDRTEEHSRRDEVVRAVAKLPPRQRAVVVLRYLEDQSESETARILGCSPGTVKSQTARALATLRAAMADDYPLPIERRTR